MPSSATSASLRSALALLRPYLRERRGAILIGLAALIVVDLLQLFIPRVVKWAVDALTLTSASPQLLLRYALYLVACGGLIGGFRYLWRRCLLGTARRVEEALRNRLFHHLQSLSAEYYDKTATGDLMAHATNDINQVRMASGMGMVALNDALFLGGAAIGFMLYIHVELTLLVLIPMPFIAFGTRLLSRQMHRRYGAVQAAFATLTETVRERFAGIRMIKAHGIEAVAVKEVGAVSRDYIDQNIALTKVTGAFFPMMLVLTNLSLVMVLYFGGRRTILAEITPGDFVAFISYLGLLAWPMMALGWVTNLIQRGRASLDRLNRIFDTPASITDPVHPERHPPADNGLQINKVSFAYEGQSDMVLDKVQFELPAGHMLGVVGPPGGGKTTLLRLLPRLYDVSAGDIRLGGVDLRRWPLEELRRRMAFAPQEPFLFAGSIRDNITLGDDAVTDADLDRVARMAALHKMLVHMPNGWDTIVGEKGVILSGGQKQRIGLARAFLRDAPILLLDDPISQVDGETGDEIVAGLRRMAARKTIIVVSHRLSAVQFADHIVTFKGGVVVEAGTPTALARSGGYFARTLQLQALEAEEPAHE
ncbi:MAG: ABC transporter ATP-binding protein [Desulfosarcinaceae bacterium]|nr:ABC transporter ATP-binding protein [Desulfosarcinaceae bacterium]